MKSINNVCKNIASSIINLSKHHKDILERWSDQEQKAGGLSNQEIAGFISNPNEEDISILMDIQAPKGDTKSILRVWLIKLTEENETTFSNNIQLDFSTNYTKTSQLLTTIKNIDQEDLIAILQDNNTLISSVTLSHNMSFNNATNQRTGKRYELTPKTDGKNLQLVDESGNEVTAEELEKLSDSILKAIKL